MAEPTGLVSDIQRFSIHDGPGIRTTVFLKGCPLACLWCHNPECRSPRPEIAFYGAKCIACGRCRETCPNRSVSEGAERIDRSRCVVCGACVRVCPSEALQVVGRLVTVADVLREVMPDEPFYRTSGGGVTLSGGEPLLQHEFSYALLRALKDRSLHTAVETSGLASWHTVARLARLTDLFLYDVKVVDPAKHRGLCKSDNATILENARKLAASGADVIFRAPIIPGLNDSPDDLRRLGEFILSLPNQPRLELLPYHRIGSGKYEALGLRYALAGLEAPIDLGEQSAFLISMGVRVTA